LVHHGERLLALGARRDFGLLHRLDRATSGLVAFALNPVAYDRLREAFAKREVQKTYLALVEGLPPEPTGTTRRRLRIARRGDLKVSLVHPAGLEAVTHWRTLGRRSRRALLECRIETGRLHQIRAHLAALGCPVIGDTVYRGSGPPDTRASVARAADKALALHAWRLRFPHPARRGFVAAEAAPPADFLRALDSAGIALPPGRQTQPARPRSAQRS
jgi:RluA family pseudouridine synthase